MYDDLFGALGRVYAPNVVDEGPLDPQVTVDRLSRKGLDQIQIQQQQRTSRSLAPSRPAPRVDAVPPAPSFGANDELVDAPQPATPEVSFGQNDAVVEADIGVPLPRPRPEKAGDGLSASEPYQYVPPAETEDATYRPGLNPAPYAADFGKGFLEGAKNMPASALKGYAAKAKGSVYDILRTLDRIDAGERVAEMDDPLGYQHMDPATRSKSRADIVAAVNQRIQDTGLYKAGAAVEEFGKKALESGRPYPGQQFTRDVGGGFGSVAAGIGTAIIPIVGPYAAGGMFVGAGAGEAADRAINANASQEQIALAARLGTVSGATDVVDALLPALGSTGRALGFMKRVGLAALAGAAAEGGQEGIQQLIQNAIAKGIYKPDQDLAEDVPYNMLIGAVVGSVTSGGTAAMQRQQVEAAIPTPEPVQTDPQAEIQRDQPSAPSAPSAEPPVPEGHVRFYHGYDEGTLDGDGSRWVTPQKDYAANFRGKKNVAYVDLPKGSPEEIALRGWDDLDERSKTNMVGRYQNGEIPEEVARRLRPLPEIGGPAQGFEPVDPLHGIQTQGGGGGMAVPGAGRDMTNSAPETITPTPAQAADRPQEPSPPAPAATPLTDASAVDSPADRTVDRDRAVLRAYGYNDEQIGEMSAAQRKQEVQDAIDGGIDPEEAVRDYGKTADEAMAGLSEMFGSQDEFVQPQDEFGQGDKTAGTKAAPVKVETEADIEAAAQNVAETPSAAQKEAENYKMGHVRWPNLGEISIETRKGSTRTAADGSWSVPNFPAHYGRIKGTIGADGQQVDAFMGGNPNATTAYVINQNDPATGKFDEHKIMLGFADQASAQAAYDAAFSDGSGPKRRAAVVPVSIPELKDWLKSGKTKKAFPVPKVQDTKERKPSRALSLVEYLAWKGGMRPDSDLRSMDLPRNIVVPGVGWKAVTRGAGMTRDQMLEAAREGGYLPPAPADRPDDVGVYRQLLDMIAEETRGRKTFAQGETDVTTERDQEREIADQNAAEDERVRSLLAEAGVPIDTVDPLDIALAGQIMREEGLEPEDAFERAVMRGAYDQEVLSDGEFDTLYGEDWWDAVQSDAALQDSADAQEPGVEDRGPVAESEDAAESGELPGAREDRGEEAEDGEGLDAAETAGPVEPAETAGTREQVIDEAFGAEDEVVDEGDDQISVGEAEDGYIEDIHEKPFYQEYTTLKAAADGNGSGPATFLAAMEEDGAIKNGKKGYTITEIGQARLDELEPIIERHWASLKKRDADYLARPHPTGTPAEIHQAALDEYNQQMADRNGVSGGVIDQRFKNIVDPLVGEVERIDVKLPKTVSVRKLSLSVQQAPLGWSWGTEVEVPSAGSFSTADARGPFVPTREDALRKAMESAEKFLNNIVADKSSSFSDKDRQSAPVALKLLREAVNLPAQEAATEQTDTGEQEGQPKTYSGPAYRAPGFEGGAPSGKTAADVVRHEIERGNVEGVPDAMMARLENLRAEAVMWVGRDPDSLWEEYGPQGAKQIKKKTEIKKVTDSVQGAQIIAEDGAGVLVLLPEFSTEQTPAGEQTVIPGAEKITDAELAQKKADEGLKPKVEQKEPGGLFGDESKQTDLLDEIGKKKETKTETDEARESGPSDSDVQAANKAAKRLSNLGKKLVGKDKAEWEKAAPTLRDLIETVEKGLGETATTKSTKASLERLGLLGEPDEATTSSGEIETVIQAEPQVDEAKQKLEDAGEKIGGARKDQWAGRLGTDDLEGMTGAERDKNVTKQNVWPRLDYASLVEDEGVEPLTAALIKRIYDGLPAKYHIPRYSGWDEQTAQVNYIKALTAAREAFKGAKTVADLRAAAEKAKETLADVDPDGQGINVLRALAPVKGRFNWSNPLDYNNADLRAAEKLVAQGFPNIEPWQRIYRIYETSFWNDVPGVAKKGDKRFVVIRKSGGSSVAEKTTREEAIAAAKKLYEDTGGREQGEGQEPTRPHLDAVDRAGPDYRKGRDVTGDDFVKDFGFRGVEFGNWVASDERQKVVNLAYDALHDLARILNLSPKALSLDGKLAVGFGSRGRGGKAAAHYEPDRVVINMTKLSGAGSLAHEWAHAVDHYLGELGSGRDYKGAVQSITGWDNKRSNYDGKIGTLSPRLSRTTNDVMNALFHQRESEETRKIRIEEKKASLRRGLQSWIDAAEQYKERIRKGERGAHQSLKKAQRQIEIWERHIAYEERSLETRTVNVDTEYYKQAKKLSGKQGEKGYWARPTEMFARAFEAMVFDKINAEGNTSQYLVQGVEGDRYAGSGFKGNPYPTGEDRTRINAAFDRWVKSLATTEGKHGAGTKLEGSTEEEPVEQTTETVDVPEITPEQKVDQLETEMQALDESTEQTESRDLSDAFAGYFRDGKAFPTIIAARKFARDAGHDVDVKEIEEAIELGVVKIAREIVEAGASPEDIYKALVNLYSLQPRLGTRTSTSVREQAYSTPVPLAYVASRLAGIGVQSRVYEPTAGNGALLLEATPSLTVANEINPARAKNLETQGFAVQRKDASEAQVQVKHYDVVIANPPFGPVREGEGSKVFDLSDIQKGYETKEIDHVIALRALAGVRDNGRAVLILGGLNKLAKTKEQRSDGYAGKAKREFYKALYDRYNVTDHFTVAGELYERQGAGWPVDVIVIEGRGKSKRALPAVDVPRIYSSWDDLGGLIDGRDASAGAIRGELGTDAGGDVVGGPDGRDEPGGDAVGGQRDNAGQSAAPDAEGIQPGSVSERPVSGETGGSEGEVDRGGGVREPGGNDPLDSAERPSSGLDDFDAAFDAALDDIFGADEAPKSSQVSVAKTAAERKPRDTRPTSEVAKSAVSNAVDSADQAMAGLVQLFGGGKTIGEGLNFDKETYAKAKPLFIQAAAKFSAFKDDITELVKRMVGEMQRAFGLTRDGLERMRPYLKQFMEDVKAGLIHPFGRPAPQAKAPVKQETETASQVAYAPKSQSQGLGTLVPVNMRRSIAESLERLAERVGDLDAFVAKELGYELDESNIPYFTNAKGEREQPFAAEQIDALALAIDNVKRGKGFIIGDQTGIGKGRVNAAMIRWAIKNGHVPVFVTEKPNLYGDMYRDLGDIDIKSALGRDVKILMTNANQNVPLDEDGKVRLVTGAKHNDVLRGLNPDTLRKEYDVVFTTYNQMQSIGSKETARRDFLRAVAPHAILIFDESHNAGGQKQERKKAGDAEGRAQLARTLIKEAKGVFYSSATYAKRPDVMDLYSKTDMVLAVEKIEDLAENIARGGVPMQQAVAAMLAEGGQYIRRERSFAGVTYDTPVVPAPREQYDGMAGALAAINDFSHYAKAAAEKIDEELKEESATVLADGSTGSSGAESINFTAIMHNVINQMLLALKAKPAVDIALEAIQRGEKPVFTVSGTMESFLTDFSANLDLKQGDVMEGDFSDVLMKYLDRTRTITIKRAFSDEKEKHYLTDEELGPIAVKFYQTAKDIIGRLDLSDLPISPLDFIKGKMEAAGYSIGEITGRTLTVDYSTEKPTLSQRKGSDKSIAGRRATIRDFNSGALDAMIINQAGATGLSLHASVSFKDQKRRHMIIVQPEANIDTHMQMLGRIHRTGQVVTPTYSQLIADVPAEKRPAAVLAKKMASLNANTTASRGGALTAKDVPDFINEYGDLVAISYIADHPDINPKLDFPVKLRDNGTYNPEDAMRKLTGRIPLLPLKQQEEVYAVLEGEYTALMDQMKAAGENALEAQTFDLKAKTLEVTQVVPAKPGSTSPFAAPVNIERVSVARLGKPFKPGEVMAKIAEELGAVNAETLSDAEIFYNAMKSQGIISDGSTYVSRVMKDPIGVLGETRGRKVLDYVAGFKEGQKEQKPISEMDIDTLANMLAMLNASYPQGWGLTAANKEVAERTSVVKAFEVYKRELLDDVGDAKKADEQRARLDAGKDRWAAVHQQLAIGRRITLKTANGNLTGIVLRVEQKGTPKNPVALSTWKATFAIADASRQITIPFSRLWEDGTASTDDALAIEIAAIPDWIERPKQTLERFENMQTEAREERFIATGNILAAYDWLNRKGSIINYTDESGTIRQGIITSRQFDLGKHAVTKGKPIRDPAEVKAWLDNNINQTIWAKGNIVRIRRVPTRYGPVSYSITAEKKKQTGGKFYLDKGLTGITGDFYSSGGGMNADVGEDRIIPAIAKMQSLGAVFTVQGEPPKPTKPSEPQLSLGAVRLTPAAEQRRADIESQLSDIVRRVVGRNVRVVFPDVINVDSAPDWGRSGPAQAMGGYLAADKLILLAMNEQALPTAEQTAYHEAFHAIEDGLLTEQEKRLLQREEARLRENLNRFFVNDALGGDRWADGIAGNEVRAISFEIYAHRRGRGLPADNLHIGIRAAFERIYQTLRRIRNLLQGYGFRTAEDIFADAYEGKIGERSATQPRTLNDLFRDMEPQYNLVPTELAQERRGVPPAPESIEGKLRARNWNRLASISRSLGFGKLRPTEARVQVQDKFIRVKNIQRAQEKATGPIPERMDTYTAESLYYGRTGEQIERLDREHIDPLIREIKRRGLTLEQVDDYLYARHAPARNEFVRQINPDVENPSGMSDEEAAAILDAIPADKLADYQEIERRVRAILNQTNETRLRGGLVSEETLEQWNAAYPDGTYVPLRGFTENLEEDEAAFHTGRGMDVRGPESRRALGRESRAEGPLAYVIMQAQEAIVRAEKDRVGRTMLRYVQANPNPALWTVNTPERKRVISPITGMVVEIVDPAWAKKDNVFAVKVGGRNHYITFHGKEGKNIARALKNIGAAQLHPIIRFLGSVTRLFARMQTAWNPDFWAANLPRDIGEAFINLGAQEQRRFRRLFLKYLIPSVGGAFQGQRGRFEGRYSRAFEEFDRAGGRIRFFGLEDPDDIKANVESKMRRLEGGLLNNTISAGEATVEAVELVSGAIENATRLAAYMAAREVGLTKEQGAKIARELTVNFNRKGELGSAISAAYAFANAAMQGTVRMAQAMKHKKVQRGAFALTALGVLMTMWNLGAGGDDDDGKPIYEKLPEWDRNKNFIIMFPKSWNRKPISIPLPYGYLPFHILGTRLTSWFYGKITKEDAITQILKSTLDTFDFIGRSENMVAHFAPTLTNPAIELYMNKGWTGRPINPENPYGRDRRPDSERSFDSASAFSKATAKKMNEWTGGDAYTRGYIDVSPGTIDYMLNFLGGGVGRFVANSVATPWKLYQGEEFDADKTPIIRRYVTTFNKEASDRDAYYKDRDKAREAPATLARKAAKKGGDAEKEEFERIRNSASDADLQGERIFEKADRQISKWRAEEKKVREDKTMSEIDRKQRIEEIRAEIATIRKNAREDYRKRQPAQ